MGRRWRRSESEDIHYLGGEMKCPVSPAAGRSSLPYGKCKSIHARLNSTTQIWEAKTVSHHDGVASFF